MNPKQALLFLGVVALCFLSTPTLALPLFGRGFFPFGAWGRFRGCGPCGGFFSGFPFGGCGPCLGGGGPVPPLPQFQPPIGPQPLPQIAPQPQPAPQQPAVYAIPKQPIVYTVSQPVVNIPAQPAVIYTAPQQQVCAIAPCPQIQDASQVLVDQVGGCPGSAPCEQLGGQPNQIDINNRNLVKILSGSQEGVTASVAPPMDLQPLSGQQEAIQQDEQAATGSEMEAAPSQQGLTRRSEHKKRCLGCPGCFGCGLRGTLPFAGPSLPRPMLPQPMLPPPQPQPEISQPIPAGPPAQSAPIVLVQPQPVVVQQPVVAQPCVAPCLESAGCDSSLCAPSVADETAPQGIVINDKNRVIIDTTGTSAPEMQLSQPSQEGSSTQDGSIEAQQPSSSF